MDFSDKRNGETLFPQIVSGPVSKKSQPPIWVKDGILMIIIKAKKEDLSEILQLQYLAYQSEAKLLNNFDIPPLKQTLQEVQSEYDRGTILKVLDDNDKIVGSVRGYTENDTLYIGKLFVHPIWQGKGIGTELLKEIERVCPHDRCELFTSSKSANNLRLYEKSGYKIFKEKEVAADLTFIYLEK